MRKQTFLIITSLFFAIFLCSAVSAADPAADGTLETADQSADQSSVNITNQSSDVVISGQVKHCSDGTPFQGVTVSVIEDGVQIASTTTQADGIYSMTLPFTGKLLQVTASSPGHNPVTNEFQFAENSQSSVINFILGMDNVWISDTTGSDTTGDGTAANPYKTLEKGIQETNSNGILHVLDGTYTGAKNRALEITNSMSIIGESQDNTIINAKGLDWIFDVHNPGLTVLFSKLTLKNAYIDWDDGAAIWIEGSTVTVSECTFIDNYADNGYNGGAIYNADGDLTITNCLFKDNYADNHGGAIYSKNGDLTVTDSTFKKNVAKKDGGAIYSKNGDLTVTNSIFKKNKAKKDDGGAIFNKNGDLTVTDSLFKKNKANNGVGGAIYTLDATSQVKNSDFIKNQAEYGGAIYNEEDNAESTLDVMDSYFSENYASDDGGAIYNYGTVTVTDSEFLDNIAEDDAGALFNGNGSEATVTESEFNGNEAEYGGAIHNDGQLSVNKSEFTENTGHEGGAIHNDGDTTINDSEFTENVGETGGAIHNEDVGVLEVTNSDFTENEADDYGGAIYNSGDEVTVIGSNLIYNTAGEEGGAFYNDGNDFKFNFNRIIGNTADESPNDIYDDNSDSKDVHDALYNWWGSNAGPSTGRIEGELVEYDPWLVMRYNANPLVIPKGSKSTLTADFRYDSSGTFHDPALGHLPDGLPVTFTTNLGNVGSKSVVAYTLNGVATATLRGDEAAGYALTSATLDFQTLYSTVQITASPANAASTTKTVGMQNTGAPVLPLLIAVLLLVSGFLVPRKK